MGRFKDLTGKKFSRLTVLGFSCWKNHTSYWLCRCDCGKETIVRGAELNNGHTKSCGCYHRDELIKRSTTHGMAKHPLSIIWSHIIQRTCNPKNAAFKHYGGRGITVCESWKKDSCSFIRWALRNGYKAGLTIDRINNNEGYNPSNCRWVNMKTQSRNRRSNRYITFNGETHCISEWAELIGISEYTISRRLRSGWSEERSLKEPLRGTKSCG